MADAAAKINVSPSAAPVSFTPTELKYENGGGRLSDSAERFAHRMADAIMPFHEVQVVVAAGGATNQALLRSNSIVVAMVRAHFDATQTYAVAGDPNSSNVVVTQKRRSIN